MTGWLPLYTSVALLIVSSSYVRAKSQQQQTKTRPKRPSFLKPSFHLLREGENDLIPTKQHLSSQSSAESGPGGQSPYEYVPVTALDDYGQSTQLRHAMESAARYGTPVLACICHNSHEIDGDGSKAKKENAILVCSLQRPRLGIIASSHEPNNGIIQTQRPNNIHPSIQGMVKILTTRDDSTKPNKSSSLPRHSLHTALTAVGIQSDISFLLNKLQTHCISKYWFRYDALPQEEVIIRMVREILLDFLGYDWSEEVGSSSLSGGIGSAAPSYADEEEEESVRAGRPLGVCTFLLGLDGDDLSSEDVPSLTVIKANGSSERYVAYAMGIGSELGNKRLSQKWRISIGANEAKDMMQEILREIAIDRGWLPENHAEKEKYVKENADVSQDLTENMDESFVSDLTMVCEAVTKDGINVEYFKIQ